MNYISSISNHWQGKFLVSKSQIEDFNDGSILTVNPGEQALFVNNGVIEGLFMNGRYELTTQNYPFINSFRRFMANGQLTYHCSIFFISETQSSEVLWGFSIPVRDPIQNIYTKIFVRGSYTVRVNDGGKLLLQLLGLNVNFLAAQDIRLYFGNRFQQQISNILARYIAKSGKEVLDLCTDTISVSDSIAPELASIAEPTGLEISNFCISAMQIDEQDPNRRILEQAYAKHREREIMGDEYDTIKDTDIRMNASRTPFAGMSFAPNYGQIGEPQTQHNIVNPQPTVQNNTNTAKSSEIDYFDRLRQLAKLKEEQLITEEEYTNLKNQILQKMI